MARYTGPKNKICRIFGEPILGSGKSLKKMSNPPGQHGGNKKRKQLGEYALQLREKQKAKYTYGLLEKQFRNTFHDAARMKGVTGDNLIILLESRLDNVVYRMGMATTRPAARQLVSHKHIMVNGELINIPSYRVQPGDVITYKPKTQVNEPLMALSTGKNPAITWIEWNDSSKTGTFVANPERANVPENIKEQLIVELYSK